MAENKDHIEVTIRTAMVIKSLSGLVGARDPLVMGLVVREAIDGIVELNNLIERMRDQQKRSARTSISPQGENNA